MVKMRVSSFWCRQSCSVVGGRRHLFIFGDRTSPFYSSHTVLTLCSLPLFRFFQLFVSQGQKLHNLLVDSDDRVMDAKEQLSKSSGIPVEKQDLKWGRKYLDDDQQFRYYGIRAGGFFDLREKA